jgi:hypothetical protein
MKQLPRSFFCTKELLTEQIDKGWSSALSSVSQFVHINGDSPTKNSSGNERLFRSLNFFLSLFDGLAMLISHPRRQHSTFVTSFSGISSKTVLIYRVTEIIVTLLFLTFLFKILRLEDYIIVCRLLFVVHQKIF